MALMHVQLVFVIVAYGPRFIACLVALYKEKMVLFVPDGMKKEACS